MAVHLLNAGRLPAALEARLAADYTLATLPPPAERAAFLAARGADFTAVVTSAAVGVARAFMTRGPPRRARGR